MRIRLVHLRTLLVKLQNSTLLNSGTPVVDRVNTLLRQSCLLLNETMDAIARDPQLQLRILDLTPIVQSLITEIDQLIIRLREVQEAISSANGGVRSSEEQIATSRAVSQAAVTNLEQIMENIGTNNAQLDQLQQLRVSIEQLAAEAQSKAQQLNAAALVLQSSARDTSEAANTARMAAMDALTQARTTEQELHQISATVAGLPYFSAEAMDALSTARAAHAQAKNQLASATQALINVDLAADGARNDLAAQMANNLKSEGDQVESSNQNLDTYVTANHTHAERLQVDVNKARSDTATLLTRAQRAYDNVRMARDTVSSTVHTFTNRLNLLSNFSDETAAVQSASEQALNMSDLLTQRSIAEQTRADQLISMHNTSLADSQNAVQYSQEALHLSTNATEVSSAFLVRDFFFWLMSFFVYFAWTDCC